MFKLFILISIVGLSSRALGATTRTVDADTIRSSDASKTYALPSITGPIMVSTGLVEETPTGTINGSNTSFTISNTIANTASVVLYQDGLTQIYTTDYTISGTTLTMVTAPAAGQSLRIKYSRY